MAKDTRELFHDDLEKVIFSRIKINIQQYPEIVGDLVEVIFEHT